jgi:hypothetical protein
MTPGCEPPRRRERQEGRKPTQKCREAARQSLRAFGERPKNRARVAEKKLDNPPWLQLLLSFARSSKPYGQAEANRKPPRGRCRVPAHRRGVGVRILPLVSVNDDRPSFYAPSCSKG